jgi:hypothetical protein
MRTSTLVLLVWSLGLCAPLAAADDARNALEHASEAMREQPPRRDAARMMLERAATSNDDSEARIEALCRLAEMDEDDGAFVQAVAHYRACAAAAPDTQWAVHASDRIDWLLARSEGSFAPLARLEHVRRDSTLSSDPSAIDWLERDAKTFPPGTVRVEARMLIAEAWLGRLQRPGDAIAELRAVANDSHADPLTASLAERELVQALADRGDIAEAAAEARAHANLLDTHFVRGVHLLARRRWQRRAAISVLAAFAGLAAVALVRARRRGTLGEAGRAVGVLAPVAVAFVAFVALAGGTLASHYESGNAMPFILLGAAALPLVLVARAWGAVGSPRRMARIGRAALCGATVLAAAFALLDVMSPEYLEGFGL